MLLLLLFFVWRGVRLRETVDGCEIQFAHETMLESITLVGMYRGIESFPGRWCRISSLLVSLPQNWDLEPEVKLHGNNTPRMGILNNHNPSRSAGVIRQLGLVVRRDEGLLAVPLQKKPGVQIPKPSTLPPTNTAPDRGPFKRKLILRRARARATFGQIP